MKQVIFERQPPMALDLTVDQAMPHLEELVNGKSPSREEEIALWLEAAVKLALERPGSRDIIERVKNMYIK